MPGFDSGVEELLVLHFGVATGVSGSLGLAGADVSVDVHTCCRSVRVSKNDTFLTGPGRGWGVIKLAGRQQRALPTRDIPCEQMSTTRDRAIQCLLDPDQQRNVRGVRRDKPGK